MKKRLLLAGLLFGTFLTGSAQVLQSENFNALPVGNLSTDLTGQTPGQGGFRTIVATGADGQLSDFQIVNENEEHGNVLQVTGSAAASSTNPSNTRIIVKDGINWASRTAGNDIVQVVFDIYAAAPVAGNTSTHDVVLYNAETNRALGGYTYNPVNGELDGLVYFSQNGQAGTYIITLGGTAEAPASIVLTPGTWATLAFSFEPSTGTASWISTDAGIDGQIVSSTIIGQQPATMAFLTDAGTGNTSAGTVKYDNYKVTAAANNENILSAPKAVVANLKQLSVYPNPATTTVNVNGGDALVNNVTIVDLNGRTVKTAKFNGVANAEVNVADLSAGVYMMTVASDKGTVTKKIVKN